MKKRSWVAIVGMLFSLTLVSCATKRLTEPIQPVGFLVRFDAGGMATNVVNWDGTPFNYAPDEKKRIGIDPTRLAFFSKSSKEPTSFLANVQGKWTKVPWTPEPTDKGAAKTQNAETHDVAQGIVAHVSPQGDIHRVMTLDGLEPQFADNIDFTTAQVVTRGSHCCWDKSWGGNGCCRCGNCTWGCSHN